mmetsp:Transcript_63130/g.113631  ORF Transcript_63130/g.113631 Transcript_63130/m.113631 type:complete len:460 (+) Transcript_63130:956-2335(+)
MGAHAEIQPDAHAGADGEVLAAPAERGGRDRAVPHEDRPIRPQLLPGRGTAHRGRRLTWPLLSGPGAGPRARPGAARHGFLFGPTQPRHVAHAGADRSQLRQGLARGPGRSRRARGVQSQGWHQRRPAPCQCLAREAAAAPLGSEVAAARAKGRLLALHRGRPLRRRAGDSGSSLPGEARLAGGGPPQPWRSQPAGPGGGELGQAAACRGGQEAAEPAARGETSQRVWGSAHHRLRRLLEGLRRPPGGGARGRPAPGGPLRCAEGGPRAGDGEGPERAGTSPERGAQAAGRAHEFPALLPDRGHDLLHAADVHVVGLRHELHGSGDRHECDPGTPYAEWLQVLLAGSCGLPGRGRHCGLLPLPAPQPQEGEEGCASSKRLRQLRQLLVQHEQQLRLWKAQVPEQLLSINSGKACGMHPVEFEQALCLHNTPSSHSKWIIFVAGNIGAGIKTLSCKLTSS